MSTTDLPRIAPHQRAGPLRCALCHGGLDAEPAGCVGCATLTHADCLRDAGACPTIGCARASPRRIVAPPERGPGQQHVAYGLAAGLASLALGLALGGLFTRSFEHLLDLALMLLVPFGFVGVCVSLSTGQLDAWRARRAPSSRPLLPWTLTAFGLVGVGLLASFLVLLEQSLYPGRVF